MEWGLLLVACIVVYRWKKRYRVAPVPPMPSLIPYPPVDTEEDFFVKWERQWDR